MRIELRILSGARAGQTEVFDKRTILVGRKPTNDLRFDLTGDLDVSSDHAQFREHNGAWFVVDNGSTNGTYVNGVPILDEAPIKDGDVIGFGKNGPTVEVRAKGDPTGKTPVVPRTGKSKTVKPAPGSMAGRQSTIERVAVAVREQTRPMKVMLAGSMIGLGAIAVAAYWFGTRDGRTQVAQMQRMLAQSDSTVAALQGRAMTGDTTLAMALQRQTDSLRAKVQEAASHGSDQEIAALTAEMGRHNERQAKLAQMDMRAIFQQNDRAVAFLFTTIDGDVKGGTAFGVTKDGLLVTNRHNVRSDATHSTSTNLEVVFSGTGTRLRARVVKIVEDVDLALIQIEQPGEYPTVAGISATGDVQVGSALAIIGFPLSFDLPMARDKATTTLNGGIVSKERIGPLLQIDAYGAHGMSGSPVFDARGLVVGVVYGGPKDLPQIIYAVPSDRVAALLGDAGKSIIR